MVKVRRLNEVYLVDAEHLQEYLNDGFEKVLPKPEKPVKAEEIETTKPKKGKKAE